MNVLKCLKLILACGMLQGAIQLSAQPASITLRCNDLRQTIDGFGVGEAEYQLCKKPFKDDRKGIEDIGKPENRRSFHFNP